MAIITKHETDRILDMLEKSYTGAKMCDDTEMMTRLSRAIVMFSMDPEKEIEDYAYDMLRNSIPDLVNYDSVTLLISIPEKNGCEMTLDDFFAQLNEAICEDYNKLSEDELTELNTRIDQRKDVL